MHQSSHHHPTSAPALSLVAGLAARTRPRVSGRVRSHAARFTHGHGRRVAYARERRSQASWPSSLLSSPPSSPSPCGRCRAFLAGLFLDGRIYLLLAGGSGSDAVHLPAFGKGNSGQLRPQASKRNVNTPFDNADHTSFARATHQCSDRRTCDSHTCARTRRG